MAHVVRLRISIAAPRGLSKACIGMTNLTITLPFTLDLTPPASQADKLFSIAFAAQWKERTSCARDSRGARTLTNDLQRYLGEVFIMDHRVFGKNAEEKKRVIIEANERNGSRISLVKMEFKQRLNNWP